MGGRVRNVRRAPIALVASVLLAACGPEYAGENRVLRGTAFVLGEGRVRSYVEVTPDGDVAALGVSLTEGVLDSLPNIMAMMQRDLAAVVGKCVDMNGDDEHDVRTECLLGVDVPLHLPRRVDSLAVQPVRSLVLTWYPQGHDRPGVYNLAHFDLRFHLTPAESRQRIRFGKCGYVVDCEDFETARVPVPTQYLPVDFVDVEAVLPGLGNHLVDAEVELVPEKQTWAFIYGAYEGHLTFWHLMATHEYLKSSPDACVPIKQPVAWEVSGRYPTQRCIRWVERRGELRMTLEGFVYREGATPAAEAR